jgi:hypothetical protein
VAKKIAFLITYNGEDGRGPTSIEHAFWDENERDRVFNADPNKAYGGKEECIVDDDARRKKALSKLDAVDRLCLLGLGYIE